MNPAVDPDILDAMELALASAAMKNMMSADLFL
jgi:hypothetical protein